ncbi:MAG: hypothetical protein KAR35_06080 [Candidatus Heimdallarchaeota archaeon]|nr:hypothetical protein [Candidatus Heimdallarchaeota archaeon]MCK5048927.1 hypothetical protein [Candidatus Heimdallarchaeota archaeon]
MVHMYVRVIADGTVEIICLGKRFRRERIHLVINPGKGLFLPGEKSSSSCPELNPEDVTHMILIGELDFKRVSTIAEAVDCVIICSSKNYQELVRAGINRKRLSVFEQGKYSDEQCWLLVDELEVKKERKRLIDAMPVLSSGLKKFKIFQRRYLINKASFLVVSFDEGETRMVIPLNKNADPLIDERLEIYHPKMLLLPREIDVNETTLKKVETVKFSSKEKSQVGSKYLARDEWVELEDIF